MVTGFKDNQLSINISAQDLSEIIQRPKYGAAQLLSYDGTVTPGAYTTLGEISGKGIIYGGYVHQSGAGSSFGCWVRFTLDGVNVFAVDWTDLLDYGLTKIHGAYLYLIKRDDANSLFTVGFSNDITFESSIKVEFYDTGGAGADVVMSMDYSLI